MKYLIIAIILVGGISSCSKVEKNTGQEDIIKHNEIGEGYMERNTDVSLYSDEGINEQNPESNPTIPQDGPLNP